MNSNRNKIILLAIVIIILLVMIPLLSKDKTTAETGNTEIQEATTEQIDAKDTKKEDTEEKSTDVDTAGSGEDVEIIIPEGMDDDGF